MPLRDISIATWIASAKPEALALPWLLTTKPLSPKNTAPLWVVEETPAPEPTPVPEQPGLQFEAAATPENASDDESIKISKDLVRALVDDLKALRALIDRIPD